jgi:hypothetical protein
MTVKPSHAARSKRCTEKPDRLFTIVPREQRIRAGLGRLDPAEHLVLRLWAESKQHGPEIRRELGQAADLAMQRPLCRRAFAHYQAGGGALSLEVWLTAVCREAGQSQSKGMLVHVREDAERVVAAALGAYQAVREAPSRAEVRGEERPAVGSLGRQEGRRARVRRVDRGVPFIPGGE